MDLVIMNRPHLLQDIRNAIHIMFSEYVQRNHHSIRVELSIASNRSISFSEGCLRWCVTFVSPAAAGMKKEIDSGHGRWSSIESLALILRHIPLSHTAAQLALWLRVFPPCMRVRGADHHHWKLSDNGRHPGSSARLI